MSIYTLMKKKKMLFMPLVSRNSFDSISWWYFHPSINVDKTVKEYLKNLLTFSIVFWRWARYLGRLWVRTAWCPKCTIRCSSATPVGIRRSKMSSGRWGQALRTIVARSCSWSSTRAWWRILDMTQPFVVVCGSGLTCVNKYIYIHV